MCLTGLPSTSTLFWHPMTPSRGSAKSRAPPTRLSVMRSAGAPSLPLLRPLPPLPSAPCSDLSPSNDHPGNFNVVLIVPIAPDDRLAPLRIAPDDRLAHPSDLHPSDHQTPSPILQTSDDRTSVFRRSLQTFRRSHISLQTIVSDLQTIAHQSSDDRFRPSDDRISAFRRSFETFRRSYISLQTIVSDLHDLVRSSDDRLSDLQTILCQTIRRSCQTFRRSYEAFRRSHETFRRSYVRPSDDRISHHTIVSDLQTIV